MRIAIACDGTKVTEHFGHCDGFTVFDAENGAIIREETIANPGHRPGFLPNFLADRGVQVVISGGMGGGAVDIFRQRGIQIVTGATGEARDAAERYLKGALISSDAVCHEHQHQDECGH